MLEGITVLSSEIVPVLEFVWTVPAVAILLLTVTIAVAITITMAYSDVEDITAMLTFVLIIAFGVAIASYVGTIQVDQYETYTVTIEESVSMTEFYKRYEILDHNGQLYTIKEKEEAGTN